MSFTHLTHRLCVCVFVSTFMYMLSSCSYVLWQIPLTDILILFKILLSNLIVKYSFALFDCILYDTNYQISQSQHLVRFQNSFKWIHSRCFFFFSIEKHSFDFDVNISNRWKKSSKTPTKRLKKEQTMHIQWLIVQMQTYLLVLESVKLWFTVAWCWHAMCTIYMELIYRA